MLLDIWVIFAAGLTLLLSISGTVVVALRARSAGKVRAELEKKCEAARVALEEGKALLDARTSTRDWKQELTARLESLDARAATTSELSPEVAIHRLILRSELTGEKADLSPHLSQAGLAESTDTAPLEALKATNAALETELAALKAERITATPVSDGEAAPTNLARERELKSLAQQFTRDSREMLSCIQSLESENRDLRASLSGTAKSAA
jgi:hypothetical protein